MSSPSNSPWRGYFPNVNPFGNSPRYDRLGSLYNNGKSINGYNDAYNADPYKGVTQTMKAVDRKDANIEAEKGEILRHPNGVTHKVGGKKHTKGGTPLFVQDQTFLFSDDKDLAFNEQELEQYDLGSPGKGAKNNTPAKVYNKNINIKHKNLMNKYALTSKDPVEQNTALRMLSKYGEKEAIIAALQERKKSEGELPDFAALPEKKEDLQQAETMAEQFQRGGIYTDKNKFKDWQKYVYGQKGITDIPEELQGFTQDSITALKQFIETNDPNGEIAASYTGIGQPVGVLAPEAEPVGVFAPENEGITSAGLPANAITGQPTVATTDPGVTTEQNKLEFPSLDSFNPQFNDLSYKLNTAQLFTDAALDKRRAPIMPLANPYRVREQKIDPNIGLSRIQANRMASLRASRQFGNAQTAAKQMADTGANRMQQEYLKGVNDFNVGQRTQAHNQNLQVAQNTQNMNNQIRAQHIDKINELEENRTNSWKRRSAQGTNIMGQYANDLDKFDAEVDIAKKMYPWQVQQYESQYGTNPIEKMNQMYQGLKRANPTMDEKTLNIMLNYGLKGAYGKQNNTANSMDFMRNYLSLGR